MNLLTAFKDLIYPPLCAGCSATRPLEQHIFCMDCIEQLPETGYHRYLQNPFTDHFKGRIGLTAGAAFLYFSRGGGTQNLLHQIKYNNRTDLITTLGRWYGKLLVQCPHWQGLDILVPVPLHWKKQRKRGYNQSAVFAKGLSEVMKLPCYPHALHRLTHDQSLTGMRRFERAETISAAFAVAHPDIVKEKNILLVDDVLTTGATLEACASALEKVPVTSIRMVTIACGEL